MAEASAIPANSPRRILVASLMGTAIEFFDFYIYATASVLVFPRLFFPAADPATATLASLATFAVAFLARPIGSAIFGHFGDRVGRKATLVAALVTMGVSTVAIGLVPGYDSIGLAAPALLALCRFGQGLGLGGEWGGAILLATEHAPPERRAWYGMFPQLGAPIGFFCSGVAFLLISRFTTEAQFLAWAWRLPFLASAVLVGIGLYVRLAITETPVFQRVLDRETRVRVPMTEVITRHPRALVLGTIVGLSIYVDFYLTTVFMLSWGMSALGYARESFLLIQLFGTLFFAAGVPLSAHLAERGRRRLLIAVNGGMALYGLAMAPLFAAGTGGTIAAVALGFLCMGLAYGPIGTVLAELFPASVRYTGSSLAYNLAGIFGASLAPYVAQWLAGRYGLWAVGAYLSAAALVSLAGLVAIRETRDTAL
ncbi:MAG: MFS transporter [Vicinamibacterales bacterium]